MTINLSFCYALQSRAWFAFTLVALSGAFVADASGEGLRLSEPVTVTDTYEVFGAPMPEEGTALSLSEAVNRSAALKGTTLRIDAEVKQVCQKKGCFFIATDGAAWARITFADYAFFVPTDSAGLRVTLVGTLSRQALSAAQAAHYAEDLGESAVQVDGPSYEYQIVATSVRLPKRDSRAGY